MRALVYLILAATWLGDTGPVQAAKPSKRLSGGELVLRLLEVKTRGAAYYELSRRANPEEAGDESTFRAGHREPEVVLCPQRGGLPPVYLVLSRFLDENPGTPPLLPRLLEGVLRRRSELLIDAFSATGERIAPFGGNNVLDDGIVEDLDGDGLIERACRTNYGIDGVARVQVLEVSTIGTVAEPRFAVLYNWGEREEWDYRFVRRGGRVEIEVGPVTAEGVRPEVTFRWDEKARRFAGPAAGDHFRVLHAGEVWRELERLRAEGLEFPPDPEFVPPVDPFERVSPEVARRVAAAKPYVAGSLRSLTNAEILRYMGKGSSVSQLEMEAFQLNRLPARFWDLPPREAALALVETNRTAHHRSGYELSMRAPGRTLATGTVRGTARSAPCYERSSVHTFLKVAPGGSSFVRVQTSTAGTVFRDLVDDRETYEVRELPIPYREARHVLNVVVALKDVRSSEVEGKRPDEAFLASTADGSAEVEARGPKGVILTKVSGTPFGSVAERWTGGYSDAIALSLATYLLEEALPERLGRAWVALAPEAGQHVFDHDLPDPPLSKAERDKLTERGARLLARFSPDASDLSFAMVSATVRMAGNQALGELAGRIEEIQASRFDDSEPAQQLKSECAVALRKIRSAGRTEVLTAWASSEEPGSMWAVRELLRSDPASAIPALELWLERTTGDAARQVFAALARVAPDRARDLARGLSAERRRDLAVAAAGLETPDAMDVAELIRVATAATTAWEQRLAAIRLLVPPEEPLRHPGPEVDRTLFQLLEPQPGDTLRFAVALASRALALRRSAGAFDAIRGHLTTGEDHGYEEMVSSLSYLAARGTDEERKALATILKPHFTQTNRMLESLFLSTFAADLRELRPDIERIATGSAEDVEGDKINRSGGRVTPVAERYHLARKILAVWDEPDAFTRAKLIVAFAFALEPWQLEGAPERADRVRSNLEDTLSRMSGPQRAELRVFVADAAKTRTETVGSDPSPASRLRELVRSAVGAEP